jgi:hypothetical protein
MPNMWAGEKGNMPGVGHQFRLWLTGYTLAQKYGCTFVHDPFCGNETQDWDGVGRVDVPVFRWEKFLNFGEGELQQSDLNLCNGARIFELFRYPAGQSVSQWEDVVGQDYDTDVLIKCPFNQFIRMYWDIYLDNRFKNKYWDRRSVDPITTAFPRDKMAIAVHVRRCDVTASRYPDRYLSNDYYVNVLRQIREVYPNSEVHIYSDAKDMSELLELVQPDVYFHLRTDIFETFHSLVSADIFVTGIGSFSILASYLSYGVTVTTEWNNAWNNFPIAQGIVPVQKNGNLSKEILKREVDTCDSI